jgi:hypothetical protein
LIERPEKRVNACNSVHDTSQSHSILNEPGSAGSLSGTESCTRRKPLLGPILRKSHPGSFWTLIVEKVSGSHLECGGASGHRLASPVRREWRPVPCAVRCLSGRCSRPEYSTLPGDPTDRVALGLDAVAVAEFAGRRRTMAPRGFERGIRCDEVGSS